MPGNFYTVTDEDVARWPPPNYINPEHRTWLAPYAITWECVTTLFVFGRICIRLRNRSSSFGLDDALIFCAWVFSVALTTIACVSIWRYDVGKHIWDVHPSNYEGALYCAWLAQVMFVHSTGATKTSVLLFYRRMATNSYDVKWLYAVWFMLSATIATWIAMLIAYCFICTPLDTYWTIHHKMAVGDDNFTCLNGEAVNISAGVLTIVSDLWSAALPCAMFRVLDLGVTRRQKTALNIIFCLGFCVAAVGAVRTYFLWKMGVDPDLSWHGFELFASSIIETQLAIILACAPFLRALFRRYFSKSSHHRISTRLSSLSSHKHLDIEPQSDATQHPYSDTRHLTLPAEVRLNLPIDAKSKRKGFYFMEREASSERQPAYDMRNMEPR